MKTEMIYYVSKTCLDRGSTNDAVIDRVALSWENQDDFNKQKARLEKTLPNFECWIEDFNSMEKGELDAEKRGISL